MKKGEALNEKGIDAFVGWVLIALMSLMTLDVLWGVFTRYMLGSQASWSEELARFLLIWIGVLGAAWAAGRKMHLSIDLLLPSLSAVGQKKLLVLINVLIIMFALLVMVVGGIRLMYVTSVLGQMSPALRVPMWVVYSVLPISGVLIVYFKLRDLFTSTKAG